MAQYFLISDKEDTEDQSFEVTKLEDGKYQIIAEKDGQKVVVDARFANKTRLHMIVDGKAYEADLTQKNHDQTEVLIQNQSVEFNILNARQKRMLSAGLGNKKDAGPRLESIMAGKVVAIEVKEGDHVEQGQTMLVVEAMKMENDLKAHRSGIVAEVAVSAGQTVDIGDLLIAIEDL